MALHALAYWQPAERLAVRGEPGPEIPKTATFVYEWINCGKSGCPTCGGVRRKHGPYWYAKWETGGRERAKMHAAYIGKAPENATPEELRAFYAARQARKGGGSWRSGSASSGGTSGSAGGASSGSTSSGTGGASSGTGSTSGRNNSDCFNSRRPPPIDVDFATIGSNRSATFEQARRAYYDAIQKEHPDRGGSEEQAKCINAAWDRIKRFYGKR